MLVTLKSLQQETFKIEIDPEQTVLDLKKKVEETKGATYAISLQKLIYAGKVMTDETKLSEYNIDEKKFIVVMVLQPKSESTPSAVASEPQQNTVQPSSPVAQSASTASSTSAVKVEPSALSGESTTPKETQSAFVAAESNLVFGDEYEKSIKQIMEMGYERKQVEKAMKASFNNPERAVEYLISGLPVSGLDDDSASVASADMASNATSGENVSTNESNPLEFLRSQPVFNQMRQIIQQNPQVLNSLMQQIGQSNPQLLQLITQNQGSFVRMLNEPDPSGQPVTAEGNPPASGRTQQGSIPGLEELIGFAQITPQDKEAIERLKALGFPEYMVVQAYFACDKNENSAANFLLSNVFDEN